jgi:hypothetical protein
LSGNYLFKVMGLSVDDKPMSLSDASPVLPTSGVTTMACVTVLQTAKAYAQGEATYDVLFETLMEAVGLSFEAGRLSVQAPKRSPYRPRQWS